MGKVTRVDGNVRVTEMVRGYSASQHDRLTVFINCAACMGDMDAIDTALQNSGFETRVNTKRATIFVRKAVQ